MCVVHAGRLVAFFIFRCCGVYVLCLMLVTRGSLCCLHAQVDILYLHNVAETQGALGDVELKTRLAEAFLWLEAARTAGRIQVQPSPIILSCAQLYFHLFLTEDQPSAGPGKEGNLMCIFLLMLTVLGVHRGPTAANMCKKEACRSEEASVKTGKSFSTYHGQLANDHTCVAGVWHGNVGLLPQAARAGRAAAADHGQAGGGRCWQESWLQVRVPSLEALCQASCTSMRMRMLFLQKTV